jgi:signal transduction histidine kinase
MSGSVEHYPLLVSPLARSMRRELSGVIGLRSRLSTTKGVTLVLWSPAPGIRQNRFVRNRRGIVPGNRRLAWVLASAGLLFAGLALVLHLLNRDPPAGLTHYVPNSAAFCAALTVLGALILRRYRWHPIGLLLVGVGLGTGFSGLGREYVALAGDGSLPPGASWAYWLASFLWYPAYALVTTLLLVVFPDGRPPSRPWWAVVAAIVGVVAIDTVWFALTPLPTDLPPELAGLRHPLGLTGEPRSPEEVLPFWPLLVLTLVLASVAALITRLARADALTRRQLGWFAIGSLLWLAFVVVDAVTDVSTAVPLLEVVFLLLPPLGAAIGILRYNLLDLDRVIHRGLVAAGAAGAAGVVYAGIVLLAERLVGRQHDFGTSAVAVGSLAVAALPLWRGLNGAVERLLFGQRTQPFEVVARLGSELEAVLDPETMLTRVARTLADSLRLPFVRIDVPGLQPVEAGSPVPERTSLPLVHNGMTVGALAVGHRSETESLDSQERSLLEDLARRVAAIADAMRLRGELARSRERLVLAREEERRRIRRDLHDGLGPQLAGIGLQLDMAREVGEDLARLDALLGRARDEVSEAILAVRRVVDGLRPPALDELGLVGAIRQQVDLLDTSPMGGLHVVVEAPDELGRLPAAVEVAAFRIATEAAANAARHSGASRCTIELRRGDALEMDIRDDGQGIDGTVGPGVGLISLPDRAEELGGKVVVESEPERGTRVVATLPLA